MGSLVHCKQLARHGLQDWSDESAYWPSGHVAWHCRIPGPEMTKEKRKDVRMTMFKICLGGYHFLWNMGCHKYPKIPQQYFCNPPIGQKKFLWHWHGTPGWATCSFIYLFFCNFIYSFIYFLYWSAHGWYKKRWNLLPPPHSWLHYWSLINFGPLVPMKTSMHFQLFWKKTASLFQIVFMCVLTNHLPIVNFTEIKASF